MRRPKEAIGHSALHWNYSKAHALLWRLTTVVVSSLYLFLQDLGLKVLASIAFPVLIIIVLLSSIIPGYSTPTHQVAPYGTAVNQPLQAWFDSPQNTTNATITSATSSTNLTASSDPRVDVTVDSFPEGAELVTVDGSSIVAPTVFSWQTGSAHTLSAVSQLSCGASCRFVFQSWSDGGGQTHNLTAPNSPTTILAIYQQQYLLTIQSNAGGTTTPPTGWQNANTPSPDTCHA